jgi:hypothetical protein
LPIPLLLAVIGGLWAADSPNSYEAPRLALVLNLLTRSLASVVIVYVAGRAFLVRGAPGLLLLGVGVAIWGASAFVASAIRTTDAN